MVSSSDEEYSSVIVPQIDPVSAQNTARGSESYCIRSNTGRPDRNETISMPELPYHGFLPSAPASLTSCVPNGMPINAAASPVPHIRMEALASAAWPTVPVHFLFLFRPATCKSTE